MRLEEEMYLFWEAEQQTQRVGHFGAIALARGMTPADVAGFLGRDED